MMASKVALGQLRKLLEDEEEEEDELEERDDNDDDWPAQISESEHNTGSEEEAEDCERSDSDIENKTFFLSKDKKYKWLKNPPSPKTTGCKSLDPEVKGVAKNARTPEHSLDLFITPAMVDTIVENTNIFIRMAASTVNVPHQYTISVDSVEMYAFLGLLYLAGIYRSKRRNLEDLWAEDGTGLQVFRTIMSFFRFRFLLCCLQFDDRLTRGARAKTDKLAAIRQYLEEFVLNCKSHYSPGGHVTLDERLEKFRGRCSFKRHIPGKSAEHGIKMFALVDSQTCYTSNLEVHAGKQPAGPYNCSYAPACVVERMIAPISGSGRNITMDNWFTSVPLSCHLLKAHELTIVGALRKGSPEIPPEFVQVRKRPVTSSTFGFTSDATLVSYVPGEGKVALLISTMHRDGKICESAEEQKKPEIVKFYDATKGGVDTVDRMCTSFHVRDWKSWPLAIFFFTMNIAAINALVVFYLNTGEKMSRTKFLKILGFSMIDKWLRRRQQGISRHLEGLKRPASNEEQQRPPKRTGRLGRCMSCPRTKDRKTKYRCCKCDKLICLEHVIPNCADCVRWRELPLYERK